MPDFQNMAVTRQGPANVNVPTHKIEATVQDGNTILNDFTGDNGILWPACLSTLTQAQQDELANDASDKLIRWKAGLP